MSYPLAEQETVIVYDSEARLFDIYSTVPKHCRRLWKRYSNMDVFSYLENDLEGKPITVRLKIPKLPPSSVFNA